MAASRGRVSPGVPINLVVARSQQWPPWHRRGTALAVARVAAFSRQSTAAGGGPTGGRPGGRMNNDSLKLPAERLISRCPAPPRTVRFKFPRGGNECGPQRPRTLPCWGVSRLALRGLGEGGRIAGYLVAARQSITRHHRQGCRAVALPRRRRRDAVRPSLIFASANTGNSFIKLIIYNGKFARRVIV